jgi:hypothetical protein
MYKELIRKSRPIYSMAMRELMRHIIIISISSCLCCLATGCENLLDVQPANSKISPTSAFENDITAASVMAGIYLDLYAGGSFASGESESITSLAGLSADELVNNPGKDRIYLDFQLNNIDPRNANVLSTWTSLYKIIFETNSLLEKVSISPGVTAKTRDQLKGEALFIRAFCYFYLVNLFGEVPIAISTDYKVNTMLERATVDAVNEQIKADLIQAESLLPEQYITTERVRPNKFVVQAFQARFYLYTKDWARAEDKSTKLLSARLFTLADLNDVFLTKSSEAIWQIKPPDLSSYTNEGFTFGTYQGPRYNVLNPEVLNSFEQGDQRREKWIREVGDGNSKIYLPFKYKKEDIGTPTTEYSTAIRLAEMFLIRSEARLNQNKLGSSIGDLDAIRLRAGLPLIRDINPGISKEDLRQLIIGERRIELLVEWGHRWFDLKRWNIADEVLKPKKQGWESSDALYPVPDAELLKNKNLYPQNPGY